jgi:predicted DNA-binding transcriptional regulator AlpA
MTLNFIFRPDFSAAPLRVVTPKEAAAMVGLSQRSLRRMAAEETFPPPIRFSHKARGWYGFEVALVVDAIMCGASEEQKRQIVQRIVANRKAAPLLGMPAPITVEALRATG